MTDSHSGQFYDVIGSASGTDESNTLRTFYDLQGEEYIQKGSLYSFKYRVLNIKGWSEFSDVLIVEAADSPS